MEEQLESLSQQQVLPFELVVGDDGSLDSTVEILRDFAKSSPFPVHVTENESNLGFADNFLSTGSRCSGGWIAFCDQDDVWLPNRIADAVRAIEIGDSELVMVVQAAELVDEHLNRTGRKLPDIKKSKTVGHNQHYGFWVMPGFTQTVRADLIQKFPWKSRPSSYYPGHRWQPNDKWTCMLANALGKVAYLHETAALYRRHDQALTGDYRGQAIWSRISKARKTGAQHYRFQEHVAIESSKILSELADTQNEDSNRRKLRNGARNFDLFAEVQAMRAQIYECPKVSARLKALYQVLKLGGYWGNPFAAMGSRSFTKDLIKAFFDWTR